MLIMRAMAIIATMALQLSIFTCGLNIHVDGFADTSAPSICQIQDQQDENAPDSFDLGCALHAAHVFTATEFHSVAMHAPIEKKPTLTFEKVAFKDVLHDIDHPPASLHS